MAAAIEAQNPLPLTAYEGRLLDSMFKLRRRIQEIKNNLAELRNLELVTERHIHSPSSDDGSEFSRISENPSLLGSIEQLSAHWNSKLHEAQLLEREFLQRFLTRRTLTVETIEEVNFVHELRTKNMWIGKVLITPSVFGGGPATGQRVQQLVDRCKLLRIDPVVTE